MKNHLDKAMTLSAYETMWEQLVAEGKSSGDNQTETYVNFTKLNWSRHTRVKKKSIVSQVLTDALSKLNSQLDIVVLTETWCGDAAQSVALFGLLDEQHDNVNLGILLRDENLGLMDKHLTNGGRSIPKVLFVQNDEVKAEWGPRPAPAQFMIKEFKANPAGRTYDDVQIDLQKWYTKDKTETQQAELLEILKSLD